MHSGYYLWPKGQFSLVINNEMYRIKIHVFINTTFNYSEISECFRYFQPMKFSLLSMILPRMQLLHTHHKILNIYHKILHLYHEIIEYTSQDFQIKQHILKWFTYLKIWCNTPFRKPTSSILVNFGGAFRLFEDPSTHTKLESENGDKIYSSIMYKMTQISMLQI